MKLGLENLVAKKPVEKEEEYIKATAEQFLQAEIDMVEAELELNKHFEMLACLTEVSVNVEELSGVITKHGVNDTIVALLGEELVNVDGFADKDAGKVTIALEANLKEIGTKVMELIEKIWESIKAFFEKVFSYTNLALPLAKKQAERLKKAGVNVEWKSDREYKLLKTEAKTKSDDVNKAVIALAETVSKELKTGKWTGTDEAYKALTDKETSFEFADADFEVIKTESKEAKDFSIKAMSKYTDYKKDVDALMALKKDIDSVKLKDISVDGTPTYDIKVVVSKISKDLRACVKSIIVELKMDLSIWANIKDKEAAK